MGSDGIYLILIGFFATISAVTNAFWLYEYHKLLNKLMSKNYAEYSQVEALKLPLPEREKEDPRVDAYDKQRVSELNSLMGMGVQELEQ